MKRKTTGTMAYDEIMDHIVKEQCAIRRLNVRKMEIDDEIAGCMRAIDFWRGELAKCNGKEVA